MPTPKDDREATRWLKGRKIVGVRLRKFRDGQGGWATDPAVDLDDGSTILFSVQETGVGEYGVAIIHAGGAADRGGDRR